MSGESADKCAAVLRTLDTIEKIQYVVDRNPHRHGKLTLGVGKQIMSPEFLKEYQPDRVIVMNPIYCNEIQKMLEGMGVETKIVSLYEVRNHISLHLTNHSRSQELYQFASKPKFRD